jgi:hypothetical protein
VLALLVEFAEERCSRAAAREDHRRAFEAFLELRSAVAALVDFGHAEFEPTLRQIDGELLFLAEACRKQLMSKYLFNRKMSSEQVTELHAAIVDLASTGYWPDVLQDMNEQLWDAAMDKIEELRRERA